MPKTILKRVPKKTDPKAQKEFMSKWTSAMSSKYEKCKDGQVVSSKTYGDLVQNNGK